LNPLVSSDVYLQRTIIKGGLARLYYLVDPDGKRLGFVGTSRAEVERFLADAHPVLKGTPSF
jgi:hypothetical protein